MTASADGVKVSVVIATVDRPALLGEALASIRAIEGGGVSFEILVGDNGSNPQTKAIVEAHGAVHVPAAKKGCAPARNAAMRLATGDFIAFLDDDDLWTENHIRGHLAEFEADPSLGAVVGQVVMTDPERRPFYQPWPAALPQGRELLETLLSGYFPQVGATVVRADVAAEIGEMDETLVGDSDWDWQLRIARRYPIGFVPQPCVLFRQRPPGGHDALQLRRVPFTRKIFLRHAVPEWRLWRSPAHFARAYFGTVTNFFDYFVEAAVQRAQDGDQAGARRAIMHACRIFPTRALRMLVAATPLRRAAAFALAGARGETATETA